MQKGYGDGILTCLKQIDARALTPLSRLPLITGRDCSGIVEYVGGGVTKFKKGDEVCEKNFLLFI